MTEKIYNVIIIGGGPAALTAAIYASRAELQPLLLEGELDCDLGIIPGGQLITTTEIENFPGFPKAITGPELIADMRAQALLFGTEIHDETVINVDYTDIFVVTTKSGQYLAKSVIVATGAVANKLDVPGVDQYWSNGVSACAVCDGILFRDKPLAIIGGGDTSMEEALFLTKYASIVYIIHRRDTLRASKVMQSRAKANKKIEFLFNHELVEVQGDTLVKNIILYDNVNLQNVNLQVNGLFFAIGHTPNTGFLKNNFPILLDNNGYIRTYPGMTYTDIQGLFAAGDCQDSRYRQAITAAGSGCMAALDLEHYLSEINE